MHTIREITRLATMLAGLIAPRIRLGFVSASVSCEHRRSSRYNPHCAPRHIIYYSEPIVNIVQLYKLPLRVAKINISDDKLKLEISDTYINKI